MSLPAARSCFLLLALTGGPALVSAQSPDPVRGRVVSALDGGPLADAVVIPLGGSGQDPVLTSAGGWFTLQVPSGTPLVVLRIGFRADTVAAVRGGEPVLIRLSPDALNLAPVMVSADRGRVTERHLESLARTLRPLHSSQDALGLLPGLVLAQHAGGGKAEQIFLRGFDADHGTDVAISVDGTPVNLVSHAHGQGYADLHFLPPAVIEAVSLRRGPLDVRDGNLATAGAVSISTRDRLSGWLEVRGGSFGRREAHAGVPFGAGAGRWGGYLVGSHQAAAGYFDSPQDFGRLNLFGKGTGPVGREAELLLTASLYDASWSASGQVPDRAVRSGVISRFGALDSTEGGVTRRLEASVALRGGPRSPYRIRVYLVRSQLALFSNFTFALRDPLHGDGIEQRDDRWMAGFSVETEAAGLGGLPGRQAGGLSVRTDAVDLLLAAQRQRHRLGALSASRVRERHAGVWIRQHWEHGAFRVEGGVRGDLFAFAVDDRLSGAPFDGIDRPRPRGRRLVGRISPKLGAEIVVGRGSVIHTGVGVGFHTNDARDVVLAGVGEETIPQAIAAEVGLRHTWGAGSTRVTAWQTDLDSELVYVGDEGVVEPSGRTRRIGVEMDLRVRPAAWLWADAALTLTRARLRDAPRGADRVPLAPRRQAQLGLTATHGGAWSVGLRWRLLADRPADDRQTITASGHSLGEFNAAWSRRCLRVLLSVENLLNASWNEAQFATTSRLPEEVEPVRELHYTPGAPRAGTVSVSLGCGGR